MKLIGSTAISGRNYAAAFIGVLGILGAPREKCWANDVTFRETIYNTDYAVAAVGGLRDTTKASLSLVGVSGTVNKAYLYWHGPMNSTNPLANATIRLNNMAVTGMNIGYSDDNCWGYNNSQAYRADVTPLVRASKNGTYFLTQYVKSGTNINANGASLMVFFSDSNTNNNRDIVIFDGNDSNAPNFYDANGWNVNLTDLAYTGGQGYIQMHVSDGQIYEDEALVVNGDVVEQRGRVFQGTSVLAANNGPSGTGRLWDVETFDITPILEAGSNTIAITHGYIGTPERARGDCISLIAAVINLPAGTVPPPPPANLAPTVTAAPEVTVNSPNAIVLQALANDADGNALTYSVAIDNVIVKTGSFAANSPATTGTIEITNAFTLGQHTVTYTVNDGQANGTFTTVVNVIDDQPPVLNVPANITVPSDLGRTTAVVRYEVTATDDFPGVTVISLPASGSAFPIGTTTVTATAVDAAGHRVQKTFTVTVIDSMPPTILCPTDILKATDPGASNAVVRYTITATDNVPGVSVSCSPASGSTFAMGITTVVCAARDARGNTANCMFTVTVIDREAPTLIMPTNQVVQMETSAESVEFNYDVEVRDNAPGATYFCMPPSGSALTLGVTNIVCIGSDTSGNNTTNSFTVTVFQISNPNLLPPVVNVPADMMVPTDRGTNNAVVEYTASVSSAAPGATLSCTPASGSVFAMGVTTVTCTGRDIVGNTTTKSFTVTVYDNENPLLNLPANIVRPVDAGLETAVVNYTVTATDNSGSVSVVCVPASGSAFPIGVTTVTCNAVDNSGNVSSGSFTVTVTNNAPVDYGCVIASKPVLWPPNHEMVPVSLWLNYKEMPVKFSSVRIVSVTSNEPETGLWADDLGPDWEITSSKTLKLKLRAERDDNGNGRVYTITVEGKDKKGNVYLCSTTVTVPKNAPPKTKKTSKK